MNSTVDYPTVLYASSSSSVTVLNSNFWKINCSICTGSHFIAKFQLIMRNTTFKNNTCNNGLIYVSEAELIISKSYFENNTALNSNSVLLTRGGTILMDNNKFINNNAISENTMLLVGSVLIMNLCVFTGNKAVSKTKGIFLSECTSAKIYNSIFTDYQNSSNIIGGIIYSIEKNGSRLFNLNLKKIY